ncbi:MAG: lycopene cyclase domain-containing protein [Frankiaceae bacterium]
MSYTVLAAAAVVFAGLADLALFRTRLLARRAFWVSYAILFGFQVLVDGVLTCRGIVRYNPGRIVGWHLACAPVEDYLFGFAMILQTLTWWVWWGRREAQGRGAPAGVA